MNKKNITPLSKFPTEVILHFYRKNRLCYTHIPTFCRYKGYNQKINQHEWWVPITGEWTDNEGKLWSPITIMFELVTGKELHERCTTIQSKQDAHWDEDGYYYGYNEWQYGYEMNFKFEGLYWEGTIKQIKEELSKREHVGIFNNKDYRKWLIKYRKAKKN